MQFRIYVAVLMTACLLGLPGIAAAQSDVTFKVPLNLTQVSADIGQIQVDCSVSSPALSVRAGSKDATNTVSGYVNVPVTGGQLVTTATVVVAVPLDAFANAAGKTSASATVIVGKPATYRCRLTGYSKTSKTWAAFSDRKETPSAFRLSPTPTDIAGSFTW